MNLPGRSPFKPSNFPKRESPDARAYEPIDITYLSGNEIRKVTFNPVRYVCRFWLSTQAIEGLQYIAPKVKCGPYVGTVLSALPRNPLLYRDSRPTELTNMDIPLLELGRFPEWDMGHERVPLHVALPRGTQAKLLTIAMHWGITNHRLPASYRQPLSRMQAVAEAVGTGLLTFDVGGPFSAEYPPVATDAKSE